MEQTEGVLAELQHPGEADVDALAAEPLASEDERRLTGERPLHADAVAAEIHQGAAVEPGIETHVRLVGEREREERAELPHLADRPCADELGRLVRLRMV